MRLGSTTPTDAQMITLLNYRYQTWNAKFGRRVTAYSATQLGFSLVASNTSKTTTPKDIERWLSVHIEDNASAAGVGSELEFDEMENVIRLQNLSTTQGQPRFVAMKQATA